ncbi:MAG: alpha/beta hydrolase [Spongiibacteraceae bacterium]
MAWREHTENFGRGKAAWREKIAANEQPKPSLNFAAANGMPLASYDFFLDELASDFHIAGLENRGAWPEHRPPPRFNWWQHAKDMEAFFEHHYREPVIAVGHSIGATVSAMLAIKRPDLFRALILIDPATLPSRLIANASRIPFIANQSPMVKGTRGRTAHWPSREVFAGAMARTGAYGRFNDEAMRHYANAGLMPSKDPQRDEPFQLRFSPQWEAYNFSTAPYLAPLLKKISVPCLLLRAEHSNLHPEQRFHKITRGLPSCIETAVLANTGHMTIQEDPAQAATAIRNWLQRKQLS